MYGIVAQANGHICVESEPGHGTVFRIYLPRTEAAVDEIVPGPTAEASRGSERILIVEDEHAVRKVAANALQRLGYKVEVVASGEAALARIREQKEAADLLLTDVVLTGMSGPELAIRVRQLRPNLRVLFMSGHVDSAMLRKGL